jgi:PAS domain S-box-containing protein
MRKTPSDHSFRILFQTALDPILIWNNARQCVDVNAAGCELLGYSYEEMLGLTIDEVSSVDLRATVPERWAMFLELGTISGEWTLCRKDGTSRLVEFRGTANFVPGLHLAFVRDLTEQKAAEQEVARQREQLRAVSARLSRVSEHERTELARELHDQLGQLLTALKMDAAFVRRQLPGDSNRSEELRSKLTNIADGLDTAIQEVRRISAEMRPVALDRLGLLEALEWLCEEFERRGGVRCRVKTDVEELHLEPDAALQLFRIVQEALTNTTRHARASRVTIVARLTDERFVLEVRDNGRGISDAALVDPGSLGLIGMRERALRAGGELTVMRNGRKGTVVKVEVPVAPRPRHHSPRKRPTGLRSST